MQNFCKQALCITAYKSPEMLDELLECTHESLKCFVHIDMKAKNSFNEVIEKYPDVIFISAFSVNWGV